MEKILHDYEERAKAEGADEEQMRRDRAFLGGDVEHSVLVKGLDFGLLAQRKAELEREREGDVDEELDKLAGSMGRKGDPEMGKAVAVKEGADSRVSSWQDRAWSRS